MTVFIVGVLPRLGLEPWTIGHEYMKDPESAEMNEKSNFRFFNYYFFLVIVVFVLRMTQIRDEFSPTTRKIKIGFFFSLFILFSTFRSFHKNLTTAEMRARWGSKYP